MKVLKASKKLITAIVSFVLSLVLCIGVCLAWFSANKKVGAKNQNIGLENGDIIKFEVTVYYLDYETDAKGENIDNSFLIVDDEVNGGNVTDRFNTRYEVDNGKDCLLTSKLDKMRPYGSTGTFATAVLIKVYYELVVSGSSYRIYVACPNGEDSAFDITTEGEGNFSSALSNAVGYYKANENGEKYSKVKESEDAFVESADKKKNYVMFKDDIIPAESGPSGTFYYIMDYVPDNFMYLSSKMVEKGGNLNSKLDFDGDLSFILETYDPDDPDDPIGGTTKPDNPEPDTPDPEPIAVTGVTLNKNTLELTKGDDETLTATVAPANATNKTVTWKTSDPNVATVSNGKVTAVGAGSANITVTTADGSYTATCAVTVNAQQSGDEKTKATIIGLASMSSGTAIAVVDNVLDFTPADARTAISKSVEITELNETTTNFSVGKGFSLENKTDKAVTVTIYLSGTDSKGTAKKAVNVTVGNATLASVSENCTSSGNVASIPQTDTYGVIEIAIAANSTCTITPDGSNRLGVYAMVVEY